MVTSRRGPSPQCKEQFGDLSLTAYTFSLAESLSFFLKKKEKSAASAGSGVYTALYTMSKRARVMSLTDRSEYPLHWTQIPELKHIV